MGGDVSDEEDPYSLVSQCGADARRIKQLVRKLPSAARSAGQDPTPRQITPMGGDVSDDEVPYSQDSQCDANARRIKEFVRKLRVQRLDEERKTRRSANGARYLEVDGLDDFLELVRI